MLKWQQKQLNKAAIRNAETKKKGINLNMKSEKITEWINEKC